MAKHRGYGTAINVDVAGTTTAFALIGQLASVTIPGQTADDIDVTTHDSPSFTREFLKGLIDPGELTFDVVLDHASSIHQSLTTLMGSTTAAKWKVIWPTTTYTVQFAAYLKGLNVESPIDDKIMASYTAKVTGVIVYST